MRICGCLVDLGLLAVAAAGARAAAPPPDGYMIQCQEDPATRRQYCFAPSKLVVAGSSRSSPLYVGKGPDLSKTTLTAVAECGKLTLALKDAKGATTAVKPPPTPAVARSLADDMCTAKIPVPAAAAGKTTPAPTTAAK